MSHLNSENQDFININTIDDLITALMTEECDHYNDIIRSSNLPVHAFADYCSWSAKCYTRNCLVENEKFELILLCWEEGQITPIHNHGGEECWVKIIDGEFREKIYTTNQAGQLYMVNTINSKTNDVTYMIDFMGYHSIENLSAQRGLSLHLYAKPIRSCRIFDENSQQFVNKDLTYHTVAPLASI